LRPASSFASAMTCRLVNQFFRLNRGKAHAIR
jgi:hypothetical protein